MFPLLLCVLGLAAQEPPPAKSTRELRLHHVHVRVADPSAAMRESLARRAGGTRTILQGHGVGIRADGRYVIFDREDGPAAGDAPRAGTVAACDEARAWAVRHGFIVPEESGLVLDLASGTPESPVAAVAVSSSDLPGAVEALRSGGVRPVQLTDETARYRLGSGLVVEIVVETDRPDTYWCPMHPDVRGPGPSACPLCAMALVPIPEPAVGEYALDVEMVPLAGRAGAAGLRLVVREPVGGARVTRFLEVHERPLHLFIISRTLAHFDHVHPEPREDGAFVLTQEIPAGEYVLIADFLPAGGTPQMIHRAIVTPGYEGALFPPPAALRAGARQQVADGVRVALEEGGVTALRPSALRFVLSDAATGEPVRDLEPFLGAAAHLLIVNADLTASIHGHPEGRASSGPVVTFDPVLPLPGPYKLWLQFQRKGRVTTVPFVIEAAPW